MFITDIFVSEYCGKKIREETKMNLWFENTITIFQHIFIKKETRFRFALNYLFSSLLFQFIVFFSNE